MTSATVNAVVHRASSLVTCDYEFTNEGDACKVRLALQDSGTDDWDKEDGDLDKEVLKGLKITVDGKDASLSRTVLGEDDDYESHFDTRQWQTFDVDFAKGQSVRVHTSYTAPHSVTNLAEHGVPYFCYSLETGATWKGSIGALNIKIDFASDVVNGSIKFVDQDEALKDLSDKDIEAFWTSHPDTVACLGKDSYEFKDRTVSYSNEDYAPDASEAVMLTFGPLVKKH